jgi:hypothetical protein
MLRAGETGCALCMNLSCEGPDIDFWEVTGLRYRGPGTNVLEGALYCYRYQRATVCDVEGAATIRTLHLYFASR